jgi:hypothetical protein
MWAFISLQGLLGLEGRRVVEKGGATFPGSLSLRAQLLPGDFVGEVCLARAKANLTT